MVQGFCDKGIFATLQYLTGRIGYVFFGVFATQPDKFRFDHSVIILEEQLRIELSGTKKIIIRIMFPFY
jgi:hypothetical protein